MDLPNLDDLTQDQRRQLLIQLLEKNIAGPIPLGTPGDEAVLPMCSYDFIQPGQSQVVIAQCFSPFKLQRIVILETTLGRSPNQSAFIPAPVVRLGGPRLLDLDEDMVHPESVRQEQPSLPWATIPRSAWEVDGCFVGNMSLFGSMGKISGDAFGPYGTLDFASETCQPGIQIALSIRHNLNEAVPFRAVVVGKVLKETLRQQPPYISIPSQQPSIFDPMRYVLPTPDVNPTYGDWMKIIGSGPDDFGGSDFFIGDNTSQIVTTTKLG